MKKLFTLTVLLASALISRAQHYTFSEDTGIYSELVDETLIENPDFENDNFNAIEIPGESIDFFGLDFNFGGITTYYFQTFGNLRIDNDSSAVIVDGIFADLDPIDDNTSISYRIEGESESLIIKVQWKNVAIANGDPNNFVNFQIWVYQYSGVIELRYGPQSDNNATGFTTDNGPYAGIFYSPDTFTSMYEKLWLSGQPDNLQEDGSPNFYFERLLGIPAEGAILRFTPTGISTGVGNEISTSNELNIYPNPVQDVLNLGKHDYRVYGLRIVSMTGEEIHKGKRLDRIKVSNLSPGTYLLEISTEAGLIYEKFIKE